MLIAIFIIGFIVIKRTEIKHRRDKLIKIYLLALKPIAHFKPRTKSEFNDKIYLSSFMSNSNINIVYRHDRLILRCYQLIRINKILKYEKLLEGKHPIMNLFHTSPKIKHKINEYIKKTEKGTPNIAAIRACVEGAQA